MEGAGGYPRAVSKVDGGFARGGHNLGALPHDPAGQETRGTAGGGALPEEAPEPLPEAVVLLDPADRGAGGSPPDGPDRRGFRRRGQHRLRLGLAPSRLRPSHEGRPDPTDPPGPAQDHGRERAPPFQDRSHGQEARTVTDRERVEHRVGGIDEFPAGTHKVVKVGRLREIGVFNIAGTFYALPNLGPHPTGPLSQGLVTRAIEAAANDPGTWDFEWVMHVEDITC